jgi:SprT protein
MQLSLFHNSEPKPAPPPVMSAQLTPDEKLRSVIGPRIPAGALEIFLRQFGEHPVRLAVVGQRTSKSGDYRPAQRGKPPRITVNGNLNQYGFLITLIHETAHHHVDLDHERRSGKITLRRKTKPLPHGDEWKTKFRELMLPYLDPAILPDDLLRVTAAYLENPRASSSADRELTEILRRYDPRGNTVSLESLPFDAVFSLHGKRFFRKKEKVRTRFRCICMQTNRIYLVSANAPVEKIR